MSALAGFLLAAGAGFFALAKHLLKPLAERAGDRLAEWLLPCERVWTYRLARTIAHVCGVIAPHGGAVRSAVEGVLADVDAIQLGDEGGAALALSIAWSLLRPALVGRLSRTSLMIVYFIIAFPAGLAMNVAGVALGGVSDREMLPRGPDSRRVCLALVTAGNLWAVAYVLAILAVAPSLVAIGLAWSVWPIIACDYVLVADCSVTVSAWRKRRVNERRAVEAAGAGTSPH